MTLVCQMLVQGAVGFAIGAGTNELAIRWVFNALFTKKKRLIAANTKNLIRTELMTAEKIAAKVNAPDVQAVIERNIRAKLDEYGDKVVDGDKLMEDALEAGAEDFSEDGDIYEITTEPDDFDAVKTDLEAKGYTFVSAEIEKVPSTYVTLTNEDDIKHMELLLEHLEEDEDIVNIWHNWDEQ